MLRALGSAALQPYIIIVLLLKKYKNPDGALWLNEG